MLPQAPLKNHRANHSVVVRTMAYALLIFISFGYLPALQAGPVRFNKAGLPLYSAADRAAANSCQQLLMPKSWPKRKRAPDCSLPHIGIHTQAAGTCTYYSLATVIEHRGFTNQPDHTPVSAPYFILQKRILDSFKAVVGNTYKQSGEVATLFPETLTKPFEGFPTDDLEAYIRRKFFIPAHMFQEDFSIEEHMESLKFRNQIHYIQILGEIKLRPLKKQITDAVKKLIKAHKNSSMLNFHNVLFLTSFSEWAQNNSRINDSLDAQTLAAFNALEVAFAQYQDLIWTLVSPNKNPAPKLDDIPSVRGYDDQGFTFTELEIRRYNASPENFDGLDFDSDEFLGLTSDTPVNYTPQFTDDNNDVVDLDTIATDIELSLKSGVPIQVGIHWHYHLLDINGIVHLTPHDALQTQPAYYTADRSRSHTLVIVGYEKNTKDKVTYYKLQNAWSTTAGDGGYFYITPEYLSVLAEQFTFFEWQ